MTWEDLLSSWPVPTALPSPSPMQLSLSQGQEPRAQLAVTCQEVAEGGASLSRARGYIPIVRPRPFVFAIRDQPWPQSDESACISTSSEWMRTYLGPWAAGRAASQLWPQNRPVVFMTA